jgi:feruloyl-CoA synthase
MLEGKPAALVLDGPVPASAGFRHLGEMLSSTAARAGSRVFLEQFTNGEWKALTYEDAFNKASAIGRALIARGLGPERPLAILSQNSIEHALMSLGAMTAGIPVAPISTAYSQLEDTARLARILDLLTPGLVFAQDPSVCARGVNLSRELNLPTMVVDTAANGEAALHRLIEEGQNAPALRTMPESGAVAKILFTSGSTGEPKGVIVTHGMMCSNQDAIREVWTFLAEAPPDIVDWLPWNHVFGGTLVFNCVLRNAGTLIIDSGRPLPGEFQATIDNIKRRPPTIHLSVPSGLGELARAMHADDELAERFFCRLRAVFSAGAALPRPTWDALHDLAAKYGRPDFRVFIGWGATETSPVVSITPEANTHCNNLGVPIPGAAIKLVANGDMSELRVRGPMVTPGYWRNRNATAAAFDEEGFYRSGDAGRLLDAADPGKGVLFDGRVAENFKLTTGTWVDVNSVRVSAIAAASPVIQDAVVTGQDRNELGLLIFPSLAGCRELARAPKASLSELIRAPAVRARVAAGLAELARARSSTRVARAILLADLPSIECGEITDKGYLNQRAILTGRAALVEQLYRNLPPAEVILPASPQ